MSTYIRTFWLSHPEYWIPHGTQQAIADRAIYDAFQQYEFTGEDDFGIIVYFDQFLRHFSRITSVSEELIQECRVYAASIVDAMDAAILQNAPESELIWYLMPWKHLKQ